MRNPPCKNCDHRHRLCHAECDGYKEWSEERKEFLKSNDREADFVHYDNLHRAKKRNHLQ